MKTEQIEARLIQGFNHTYQVDVRIKNFPQPIKDELVRLLSEIKVLCETCDATYKEMIQND